MLQLISIEVPPHTVFSSHLAIVSITAAQKAKRSIISFQGMFSSILVNHRPLSNDPSVLSGMVLPLRVRSVLLLRLRDSVPPTHVNYCACPIHHNARD